MPAVADWIDAINDATEFVITRAADTSVGRIEYEMARAPLEQISSPRPDELHRHTERVQHRVRGKRRTRRGL